MTALSTVGKVTLTALVCGLCAFAQGNSGDLAPNGRGMGTIDHPTNGNANPGGFARPGGGNGISYHNGPILTGMINVYYIWYGDWTKDPTGVAILNNLGSSIGGSSYFKINTTYYNASKTPISNTVSLVATTDDNYSQGKSLSDSQIQAVVANAISSGKLPSDANGVYFVLTAPDVTATSGFCTKYCGWHTYATINGTDIKYSFVGNAATQCLSSCSAQATSPNGDAGADAMASVIAHELEEAATDPDLNAWYDNRGYENADKCAWTFGTTSTAGNGSKYNVTLGGKQYLIQQNWVNASGGYCAMSY